MIEFLEAATAAGEVMRIPRRIKSYIVTDVIGTGAYGIVVSLTDVNMKETFAAKVIKRPKANTVLMTHVERELRMCLIVDSPYLVKCTDVVYLEDIICILMERVEGESLTHMICKNGGLVRCYWKKIFWQMCLALQYLHRRGFAHRDVKLDNFIIDEDFNVKLCDYGIMCQTNSGSMYTTICGTIPYLSPEIIKQKGYCAKKSDIWALGIVLYGIMTGIFPWDSDNTVRIYRQILEGEIDVRKLPDDAREIFLMCCDRDPETRITADLLLSTRSIQLPTVQRIELGKVKCSASLLKSMFPDRHVKPLMPRRQGLFALARQHVGSYIPFQRSVVCYRDRLLP